MKVLILSGSRNPEGQTAQAAEALRQGVVDAGGSAEILYLPPMHLERCRQCDDRGWGACLAEGRCVIEDDFAGLVERLRQADAAVFATPVYFGDLAESLRAFSDRLRRICRHEKGNRGITGKRAVGLCVAGGGGGGAPNCTESLERTLQHTGFDVVDMVPARRQNLDLKKDVLHLTGRWLVSAPASD